MVPDEAPAADAGGSGVNNTDVQQIRHIRSVLHVLTGRQKCKASKKEDYFRRRLRDNEIVSSRIM